MTKRFVLILAVIGLFFGLKSQASFDLSNGSIIKGSGPEVYVLEYGTKRWFPNPAVFSGLMYDWNKIIYVSDDVLNSFPRGNDIYDALPNGALIKTSKNPNVFIYDSPQFRWVPNSDIFNSNKFSWGNIIIIPEEWMDSLGLVAGSSPSTDVKRGEFLVTPTTFIIAKPPAEINATEVTFVYSGTNPTGPVSELTWETYLDGVDPSWMPMSTIYTRVINLPKVNKKYNFFVRSRNKDGRVDPYPASYSFKVIGFFFDSSSYSDSDTQLKITNYMINSDGLADGFITITNYSSKSINVTGMSFRNNNNEIFYIPQGFQYLYLGSGDSSGDIILESNKSVTIFSGFSPVGKNFLLNNCMGYLNNNYNFSPKLPEECPKPFSQDLIGLSTSCRNYINDLPVCTFPDATDKSIASDGQCTDYLAKTFNYSGCVAKYGRYPDFLKNNWYVYLNRGSGFMGNSSDEIRLLNRNGGLIDAVSY